MRLQRVAQLLALAAAAAVPGAAAQQLTLQFCNASFPPARFAWAGDVPTDGNGLCLGTPGGSGGAITAQACVPGALAQAWRLNADGTLESAAFAGLCFNVFGGGSQPGTELLLYACGEAAPRGVGAGQCHSYFAKEADGSLRALESGLCASSAAVPPPPPPPPGTCTDAWDCSLNGECAAGVCACYAPWTGTLNCESLQFAPTPLQRGYPTPGHNETTWGGSIVLDPAGGLYHMYVAEMMNECPLSTWGQNSRCTHATSPTPEGPYVFADVAVANWCHNPSISATRLPNGTYLYALFHIGDGTGGATKNCTAARGEGRAFAAAGAAGGSTLHTATSPYGPFVAANPLPPCNNPSQFLHPNGTWLLVCNGFTLYSAPDVQGPWAHVSDIRASNSDPLPGNYEDPNFWVDARGMFHVIYHVYRTAGADAHNCLPGHDGSVVSGHYFSTDGFTWRGARVAPYGNVIDLADGSQQLLTTRERPKFIFSNGEPTHLANGVCPSPGNFNTPISCPEVSTGCVDCKRVACRGRGRGGSSTRAPAPLRPRCLTSLAPPPAPPLAAPKRYNDWDFTNVSPLKI